MCHHHKPIDLIAERYVEDEADDETEPDSETPTLTPPADD